jgi:ketosteroid isomerase-like protein
LLNAPAAWQYCIRSSIVICTETGEKRRVLPEVSMRCFSLRAVAVLLCSVVLVCGPLAVAQTSSRDSKPNAELLKADRDFFAAVKARKLEGWMEFMSEETTLFRDKPYTGLQAIRANVAGDFNDPTFSLTWDPETAVLLESGQMGYTSGHYVVSGTDNGKAYKSGGQYITIWKKQKDGSWKVLWDGGSSTGPKK